MDTVLVKSVKTKSREGIFIKHSSRTDILMLIDTLLLVVVGLIMMYSASYIKAYSYGRSGLAYFTNQAIFAAVGIVAMIFISHINYRILHTLSWPVWAFMILSGFLLLLTLFSKSTSRRWLGVGDMFSFQPSELVKLAVILFVSHIASLRPEMMRNFKYGFVQPMIVLAFYAGIMLMQPHFSGMIIVTVLMIAMLFIGGVKFRWYIVLGIAIIGLAFLLISLKALPTYVLNRIAAFTGSGEGTSADNYQTEQSLIAIGSGGFNGLGLGNSRQKHHFLPEPQNDFLFAVVCEELGFRGGLLVIALFVYFVSRGLSISLKAKDKFGAMLSIGITIEIAVQVILNIAVVTNSITNTGISLPFFSQGGTSLIVLLAEVGLLLSIARYTNTQNRLKETRGL